LTEKCAIFCVRYSQNYKLTPAPSENCFAIFLLRVRSNNFMIDKVKFLGLKLLLFQEPFANISAEKVYFKFYH
jgi:hypothetical protein